MPLLPARYLSRVAAGRAGSLNGGPQQDLYANRRRRPHRARHRRARAQAFAAHRCLRHGRRDQRGDRHGPHPPGCARAPTSTPCWSASRTICSISAPTSRCRSATRRHAKAGRPPLRVSEAQVKRLEDEIDAHERASSHRCDRSCCRAARPRPPRCTWRARCAAGPSGSWSSSPALPDEPVGGAGPQVHQPPVRSAVRGQPLRQRSREGDVLWVPGQNR